MRSLYIDSSAIQSRLAKKSGPLILGLTLVSQGCLVRKSMITQPKELVTSQVELRGLFNYEVFFHRVDAEKVEYLVRTVCTREFSELHDRRLEPPEFVTKENCTDDPQEVPLEAFNSRFKETLKQATESNSTNAILGRAEALNQIRLEYRQLLVEALAPQTDPLMKAHSAQNAIEYQQEIEGLTLKIEMLTGGVNQINDLIQNLQTNWNHYLQNWIKSNLPVLIHKKSDGVSDRYDNKNISLPSSSQLLADVVKLNFDRTQDYLVQAGQLAPVQSNDVRKWNFENFLAKNELTINLSWNNLRSQKKTFLLFSNQGSPLYSWVELDSNRENSLKFAKTKNLPVCRLFGPTTNEPKEPNEEKINLSGQFVHSPKVEVLSDFPMFNLRRKSEAVSAQEITRISAECGFLTDYTTEDVVQKTGLFKKGVFRYLRHVNLEQTIYKQEKTKHFSFNDLESVFPNNLASFETLGDEK